VVEGVEKFSPELELRDAEFPRTGEIQGLQSASANLRVRLSGLLRRPVMLV
jgi:hypothetical protein